MFHNVARDSTFGKMINPAIIADATHFMAMIGNLL